MKKTEIDKIHQLEKEGFSSSFKIKDGKLLDFKSQVSYSPSEVEIMEEYRYEGMSNPGDLSILFTFKTKDSKRGYILASYGPTRDHSTTWFFNKVEQMKNL